MDDLDWVSPRSKSPLTEAQWGILDGMIRANPTIINRHVIDGFRRATGRTISAWTIKKCRHRIGLSRPSGCPPNPIPDPESLPMIVAEEPEDDPDDHLTRRERSILLAIMDEFPDDSPLQIVAMLASEIGIGNRATG